MSGIMGSSKPPVDHALIAERKAVQARLAKEQAVIQASKVEEELARKRGLRGASSLISGSSGGAGFGTTDTLG
tara:strand:- start:114 stop:332 length:219 start_codon:yes stop_codon:yes gene_type:complete